MRTQERIHPEQVVRLKATKSPRTKGGPFADLTWEQQRAAEQWLWKFCKRWEGNLPQWRRAILIGVARKLAKNPPTKAWGKSLLCCKGGKAVADLYRRTGVHAGYKALIDRGTPLHSFRRRAA